jgi:hypothetical protein
VPTFLENRIEKTHLRQVTKARSLAMVSDTPNGLLDAGVTQLATIA